MRNMALCLLVFVLAVLGVMGIGAQQGQQTDKQARDFEAGLKILDEQLPVVDFNAPKPSEGAGRTKRLAKDRRHNLRKHPIGERLTIMSTVYEWPADFPALPGEESTAVVIGRVSDTKAHISEDRSGVYSEAVVRVDEVLKAKTGIPSRVVAEREGGRVRFPSGTIFRYFVAGLGFPKVHRRYLLFLQQLEDGDFSIVTGYELFDGRVIPLDESGVVPFQKYKDSDEIKFINEVRELLRN